jgi:YVTN family beta-propeller protein
MVVSLDGRWLYVMCEASDEVRVVDAQNGTVAKTVPVGHTPRGIVLSGNGTKLYVANSSDDTVSEIDTASLKVTRTMGTGFEPNGVAKFRKLPANETFRASA